MRRAPHQSVTGLLAALFAAFLIIAPLIATDKRRRRAHPAVPGT